MANQSPQEIEPRTTSRSVSARVREKVIRGLLAVSLLAVVIPVLLIVFFLLKEGLPAISVGFLTQNPMRGMTAGGIRPAILGTLALVVLTVLLAVPVGVLAAVYLTEYAKQSAITRAIRLAIVNLAGVPSVVYGLFGLGLFVYALNFQASMLAAACTLAVLVLPLIITASEEALLTVPASFREASLALGASKWQTIWQVVLPSALPGILTGVILAIGRAAGETAPIMFTGAAFYLLQPEYAGMREAIQDTLFGQFMALPYHLFMLATTVTGDPAVLKPLQWGTALVLLGLVLGMNILAMVLRSHLRRQRKW